MKSLLEIIKENIDPSDLVNHYYTEHGKLVRLDETIAENRHLVSTVGYYQSQYDEYAYDDGITYSELFVYEGRLFSHEEFSKIDLEHEHLTLLNQRREKLVTEIKELENEKNSLSTFARDNKKGIETNKAFELAFNLMTNTKRFIFVLENENSYYIIDNKLKSTSPQSDIDEDDYYNDYSRYKDVKFTFTRDLSRYGNRENGNFSYDILLEKERKDSYRTDTSYIKNKDFNVEVFFFDTFEELQELIDDLINTDKLYHTRYLQIVKNYNLKIHSDVAESFKKSIIEKTKTYRENFKVSVNQQNENINKLDLQIKEVEELTNNDIDKLIEYARKVNL